VNPVILAAFLTDAHRERLTTALLRTSHAEEADLTLYALVSPWHEDRLLPWLVDRLKTAEPSSWAGQRLRQLIMRSGTSEAPTSGGETPTSGSVALTAGSEPLPRGSGIPSVGNESLTAAARNCPRAAARCRLAMRLCRVAMERCQRAA
jgi:hypothetical protein